MVLEIFMKLCMLHILEKLFCHKNWGNGPKTVFFEFKAGTNSGKLKVDSMIFGWAWSKMAMEFKFMRP